MSIPNPNSKKCHLPISPQLQGYPCTSPYHATIVSDIGPTLKTWPRLEEAMHLRTISLGIQHAKFLKTEVNPIPLVQ